MLFATEQRWNQTTLNGLDRTAKWNLACHQNLLCPTFVSTNSQIVNEYRCSHSTNFKLLASCSTYGELYHV